MSELKVIEKEIPKPTTVKQVQITLSMAEAWWLGNLLSRTPVQGDPLYSLYLDLSKEVSDLHHKGEAFRQNAKGAVVKFVKSERDAYERMVERYG